jgi:hypothetical protein
VNDLRKECFYDGGKTVCHKFKEKMAKKKLANNSW